MIATNPGRHAVRRLFFISHTSLSLPHSSQQRHHDLCSQSKVSVCPKLDQYFRQVVDGGRVPTGWSLKSSNPLPLTSQFPSKKRKVISSDDESDEGKSDNEEKDELESSSEGTIDIAQSVPPTPVSVQKGSSGLPSKKMIPFVAIPPPKSSKPTTPDPKIALLKTRSQSKKADQPTPVEPFDLGGITVYEDTEIEARWIPPNRFKVR